MNPFIQLCYVNKMWSSIFGFKHPVFNKNRLIEEHEDNYFLNPIEVEKGILKCRKCKKTKIFSTHVQTRSADEPMSLIAMCYSCGYKWIK
ncbi:Transcription factor SII homolog [Lymphocystis disease virus 1]|uniref:Transcription factor SII homolog n=1 Tax=Fish lymphocystis disease virus TaxID=36363 RepID=UPI0000161EFD|nr:Transcription factor SII homolog [Lymphocystis disease virus 1]